MTAIEIAKLVCSVELKQDKLNTQLKSLEARLKSLSLGVRIPVTIEMDGQSKAILSQLGGIGRSRGGGGVQASGGGMQAGSGSSGTYRLAGYGMSVAQTPLVGLEGFDPAIRRRVMQNTPRFNRSYSLPSGIGGFGTGFFGGVTGMYGVNPSMVAGQLTASGLGGAVRSAANSEYFGANIGRISGYGRGQQESLISGLYGVGQRVPIGIGDIRGIAEVGARQGIGQSNPDELVKFTEALSRIKMIAPDIGVDKLATDLSNLAGLFNVSGDNIEGLGSAIVRLDEVTRASAKDIIDIMGRISPAAKILGMGPGQTAAMAAVMKEGMLRNESGSTAALRMMNVLESDPGKVLSTLGIGGPQFDRANDNDPLGKLKMVVGSVQSAMSRGSGDAFDMIRSMGFKNQRDIAFMTQFGSASGQGFGRLSELTGIANAELANPTASRKVTDTLGQTLNSSVDRLKTSFDQLGTSIGGMTNGPLKSFVDRLNQAVQTAGNGGGARSILGGIDTTAMARATVQRQRRAGITSRPGYWKALGDSHRMAGFEANLAAGAITSGAAIGPAIRGDVFTDSERATMDLGSRVRMMPGMSDAARMAIMASTAVTSRLTGGASGSNASTPQARMYDLLSYDQKMRSQFGLNDFTPKKDRGDLTMSSTVDFIGKQQMDILSGDLQKQQLEAQKEANKILMDIAKSGGMNIGGAIAMAAIGGTA